MNNNKDQRGHPMNPSRFWIIGAGRFGQIAVERITRHIAHATIIVVDKNHATIDGDGITIREDGIEWLNAMFDRDSPVDMIVPAIPVHVASDWLKLNLKNSYDITPVRIPESWLSRMPHSLRGKTGQVFVSHADFICPDNCPEPEKICTHTGKPRPPDMFRLLEKLEANDALPIVIRSYQLLPGVGGIYPTDLWSALDTVRNNCQKTLMIATACRCHGVVDFMRLEVKRGKAGRS